MCPLDATTPADLEEIVPLLQRAGITSVRELADCSASEVADDLHMTGHVLHVAVGKSRDQLFVSILQDICDAVFSRKQAKKLLEVARANVGSNMGKNDAHSNVQQASKVIQVLSTSADSHMSSGDHTVVCAVNVELSECSPDCC